MKTLKKYYWIAALAVLGLGGWAGTHVVAQWQHNNLFKKFTQKSESNPRELMTSPDADEIRWKRDHPNENPGPATNHLEGSAIHVAHWDDEDQNLFNQYSTMFAHIESIAGTAEGYYVFYRITPVQYEYKFFEIKSNTAQDALSRQQLKELMTSGYALADVTRADYTSAFHNDKRHVLLKRRIDQQPLPEAGRPILVTELGSTASEAALTAGFAPFRRGNNKILGMGEWSEFYEVLFVELDRPEALEFTTQYIEVDDDYPDRTVSQIQDTIHKQEVTQGWRFVKADRYDGWNDWITLIFSRPIR